MQYRADVDGLRTIAVVPVVLYHAGLPGFGGGFVGVDVFFVISGYLITKIILMDLAGPGFSLARFYERRIRRIFPALVAVLLFCLVVGGLIYMPADYAQLGRSVVAVTLFASNFYFWRSTDYFNPDADAHPLLHTWSLAVEEQYYIFYPLLLLLLHRRRWPMLPALLVITALSLAAASLLVFVKPSATFYLLPTRAWELMIGGIVAIGTRSPARSYRVDAVAAAAGAALILIPVVAYGSKTPFPGLAALPPVLGAALLIWSGAGPRATPMHRLLGSRAFTFVGVASYSFYLWHVPLLSFAAHLHGGELPLGPALGACALAFLMAVASLHLIERPFRRSGGAASLRSPAVMLPSAGMLAAALAGLWLVRTDGLPERLDPGAARLASAAEDKGRHPDECMSNGDVIVRPADACRLGAPNARPATLLWGDSHAMVTATAMEVEARRQGAAFLFAASADCPIGTGFSISDATERTLTTTPSYRYCGAYNAAMLERALGDPAITTVVLSSRWTNWRLGEPAHPAEPSVDLRLADASGVASSGAANRATFERGFADLLGRLTAAGKRVFVVAPLPEPAASVPQTLFVQRFGFAPGLRDPTLADYERRHRSILAIFERLGQDVPQVRFLWPHTALCEPDGRCPLLRDGVPVFFDHNHLSVSAARRTAPIYAPVFQR